MGGLGEIKAVLCVPDCHDALKAHFLSAKLALYCPATWEDPADSVSNLQQ